MILGPDRGLGGRRRRLPRCRDLGEQRKRQPEGDRRRSEQPCGRQGCRSRSSGGSCRLTAGGRRGAGRSRSEADQQEGGDRGRRGRRRGPEVEAARRQSRRRSRIARQSKRSVDEGSQGGGFRPKGTGGRKSRISKLKSRTSRARSQSPANRGERDQDSVGITRGGWLEAVAHQDGRGGVQRVGRGTGHRARSGRGRAPAGGVCELVDISADELVPGDVVSFEAGDKIPADGRLLVAATLEIEEAALTGESTPVPKALESVEDKEAGLGDRVDMAYMNSTVTRGRGEMVVMATHRTAWDPRRRPRRSGRHLRGGRRNRARSPLRLSDLSLGDGPGGSDLATPAIAALSLCGIAYGQ